MPALSFQLRYCLIVLTVPIFIAGCGGQDSEGKVSLFSGDPGAVCTENCGGSSNGSGETPELSSIQPSTGANGDLITINGSNLIGQGGPTKVTFDGVAAIIVVKTDTRLEVLAPTQPKGFATPRSIDVTVDVEGRKSKSLSFQYTTNNPCNGTFGVASIAPNSGTKGDTVTLKGEGFPQDPNDLIIQFDGVPANIINIVDPSTAIINIPDLDKLALNAHTAKPPRTYKPDLVTVNKESNCQFSKANLVTYDDRDRDRDGILTSDELIGRLTGYKYPTDPDNPDTDGDGLGDGIEVGEVPMYFPNQPTVPWTLTGCTPTEKDTDSNGFDDADDINYQYGEISNGRSYPGLSCTQGFDHDQDGFLHNAAPVDCDDHDHNIHPPDPNDPAPLNGINESCGYPDVAKCTVRFPHHGSEPQPTLYWSLEIKVDSSKINYPSTTWEDIYTWDLITSEANSYYIKDRIQFNRNGGMICSDGIWDGYPPCNVEDPSMAPFKVHAFRAAPLPWEPLNGSGNPSAPSNASKSAYADGRDKHKYGLNPCDFGITNPNSYCTWQGSLSKSFGDCFARRFDYSPVSAGSEKVLCKLFQEQLVPNFRNNEANKQKLSVAANQKGNQLTLKTMFSIYEVDHDSVMGWINNGEVGYYQKTCIVGD